MNKIVEWLEENGHEYKERKKKPELNLKICPICGAVSSKTGKISSENYWSFSINYEKGYFRCLRGSCGARGHINTLAKKKIHSGNYTSNETNFKHDEFQEEFKSKLNGVAVYVTDIASDTIREQTIKNLIESRKISSKTIKKLNGIFCKTTGDLFIPCLEEGIAVNFKRRFSKVKEWKGRMIKGVNSSTGKNVFYGMQNAIDFDKPLVIVEGEYELLTLVECGYDNVVSIPSGASSVDFVDNCWEFLDEFKDIILWYDNDEAGKKGSKLMSKKLIKWNLKNIESFEKDANEVLIKHGKEKVLEYIKNAKEVKLDGISDLSSDVKREKMSEIEAISCGIYGIDRIMLGIRKSEMTIWSGKNNHGKSTLLGQFILNLIEKDEKIFLYSGELKKSLIKEWIFSQACTTADLVEYKHPISKDIKYEVSDEAYRKIEKWCEGKIYIYDKDEMPTEESMIEIMELAHHKKGCKHFFIDNMIMMDLKITDGNKWNKQVQFMNRFKEFIMRNNVHGNLVVHPYKTDKELITKDDVGGTGEITSLADNVLIVHKLKRGEKFNGSECEFDAMVNIDKGRVGTTGHVYLNFNPNTKRLYTPTDTREENFKYGWNNYKYDPIDENIDDMFPEWDGDI